jgi:hypothetical protein
LHLHGHRKKLLREGEHADAVVTECTGVNLTEGGWSAYKLVLEVHFPDGSQGELREKVGIGDIGALRARVGEVLPVRYDPQDRSSAAIDLPAVRAQVEEAQRRVDQEALARGRSALEGRPAPSQEGAPGARLEGVREQLVELTNLRRSLDAGEIGPEEYQRRRAEIAPPTMPS